MRGLKIFDSNGNKILDVTDRLTRVCGSIQTGTAGGSITDDILLTGIPWCFLSHEGLSNEAYWLGAGYWKVTISGNTLSWTFMGWDNTAYNQKIIYGVY